MLFRSLNYSNMIQLDGEDLPVSGVTIGQGFVTNPQMYMSYQQCQFRAHATLLHKLQGLDDKLALLRALGAGTGFGNPLLVAWDRVPYSFVVDWAFRLSDVLKLVAFQPFTGDWRLSDTHYTLKHTGSIQVWDSVYPTLNSHRWERCGTLYFRRFTRRLGLPVNPFDLGVPEFSRTQQALIVALAGNSQGRL